MTTAAVRDEDVAFCRMQGHGITAAVYVSRNASVQVGRHRWLTLIIRHDRGRAGQLCLPRRKPTTPRLTSRHADAVPVADRCDDRSRHAHGLPRLVVRHEVGFALWLDEPRDGDQHVEVRQLEALPDRHQPFRLMAANFAAPNSSSVSTPCWWSAASPLSSSARPAAAG